MVTFVPDGAPFLEHAFVLFKIYCKVLGGATNFQIQLVCMEYLSSIDRIRILKIPLWKKIGLFFSVGCVEKG